MVFLQVLKASASHGKVVLFWPKVVVGPRTPPPSTAPTTQKYHFLFFDATPKTTENAVKFSAWLLELKWTTQIVEVASLINEFG